MPSRSEGREGSSRRSRSRRHRSRRRDHHRHHRSRSVQNRLKNGEKNLPAAVCNMLAIVLLCTSLAEPKWISLTGGGCMAAGKALHHLGTYQFFYPGQFVSQERNFADDSILHITYQYGESEIDSKFKVCECVCSVLDQIDSFYCQGYD